MWYGFKRSPNLKRIYQNFKNRSNLKNRRIGYTLPKRTFTPKLNFRFQVPASWKFLILTPLSSQYFNDIFFLYNNTYFINLLITANHQTLRYDSQTRTLQIKSFQTPYTYLWYLKSLHDLCSRFQKPFFLKIKFKGKGYYVYKNSRNTIAPQFGYAHRVYIYTFYNSVNFLSKTKVLLFGLSKRDILEAGHRLYATRPINIFTGRGVRFAKQVIYRKTGKVGAYR